MARGFMSPQPAPGAARLGVDVTTVRARLAGLTAVEKVDLERALDEGELGIA